METVDGRAARCGWVLERVDGTAARNHPSQNSYWRPVISRMEQWAPPPDGHSALADTRDEAKLTEVREQCAAIARDNGAPVKTEEDAQAWVQDVLCKAYTARTLMRKLKGWKVQ